MGQRTLLECIEKKRMELVKTGLTQGLTSKAVLIISQELDELLNQYNNGKENHLQN